MKKLCVSAGLLALGAAAAHAQYQSQYAPGLTSTEASKPWSLTATIRGFYDDNYLTLPKTIADPNVAGKFIEGARSSFGTELSPTVGYNHTTPDTLLSATYTYDMRWYQDNGGTTDQTHEAKIAFSHEFSERYKMQVTDTFVVAQEPQIVDPAIISSPLRIPGNNVHNTGTMDFTAQLTRLFDLHLGYVNSIYAYQVNAGDETLLPGESRYASYSALLDRIDQTGSIDLRWKARPETTGVLGYQFENLDYTSPEYIIYPVNAGAVNPLTGVPIMVNIPGQTASSRNQNSHYIYLGADQSFSHTLTASLRAGVQYVDYYNYGTSSLSPYADFSVIYQYMTDCSAQLGVRQAHNTTDIAGLYGDLDNGTASSPVLDTDTTTVYFNVSHRATQRLTAGLMGQAQYSSYNGGGETFNGIEENLYLLNLNLTYHFNAWLAAESGYSFTKLNSDDPLGGRSYVRNQVYLGIRGEY